MNDENKKQQPENTRQDKEVSLEDLEEVSGGSIRDVRFTPTKPISADTASKV